MPKKVTPKPDVLLGDLRQLISTSQRRAAAAVNSELVWLYWQIGRRIREDILGADRAAYGQQVIRAVAASLSAEYGRGFTARNLYNMVRFAETFPDPEIVHALRAHLSWTHLRELLAIDDPLRRQFYTELCRIERWSTRTLTATSTRSAQGRTRPPTAPSSSVQSSATSREHHDPSLRETSRCQRWDPPVDRGLLRAPLRSAE